MGFVNQTPQAGVEVLGEGGIATVGSLANDITSWPVDNSVVDLATSTRIAAPVTITEPGVAFTEGAWVELVASTQGDSGGLRLTFNTTSAVSAGNSSALVRIGLGAGTPVEWAVVAMGYYTPLTTLSQHFDIPGFIPAGSRISAQFLRSAQISRNQAIRPQPLAYQPGEPMLPPVMGPYNLATARGTALTPAAVNVKNAWATLWSSVPRELTRLLVNPQGNGDTSLLGNGYLVDIGIGPSGSTTPTQVIMPDLYLLGTTAESISRFSVMTRTVKIPAGWDILGRYQTGGLSNGLDLQLVGA